MLDSRIFSDPVIEIRDWEQFQSLTSELISPIIQINLGEVDEVAHVFTASIAFMSRQAV
jgi:hypothetical protein